MSAALQRAQLLLQQRRHGDAAAAAREAIAADPDNAWGYFLLSRALAGDDQHREALEAAEAALARAPNEPGFHLARVFPLLSLRKPKEAEAAARAALELAPDAPEAFNALAWSLMSQKRWKAAFEVATEGLRLEPDHPGLTGARAQAERQLGRAVDAHDTLEAALARDPENAFTHYQLGWTWLNRNDAKKAMQHFGEALRIDPSFDEARAGLVSAMKARNVFYAAFLRYSIFMSRFTAKAQWAIWIGAYLVVKVSLRLAQEMGQPVVGYSILGLYVLFVWSTYTLDSLFNLLLRCDRHGRHALSEDQKRGAHLTGGLLLLALACGLAALLPGAWVLVAPALAALAMMIPGASLFRYERRRNRLICGGYLGLLGVVWLGSVASALVHEAEQCVFLALGVYLGSILFSWLNLALSARD